MSYMKPILRKPPGISVRLSEPLRAKLTRFAKRNRLTRTAVVTAAVSAYLAGKEGEQ